jgi:hypothetical protein
MEGKYHLHDGKASSRVCMALLKREVKLSLISCVQTNLYELYCETSFFEIVFDILCKANHVFISSIDLFLS